MLMRTCCSPRCAGPAPPTLFGSAYRRGDTQGRVARRSCETGRTRFVRGLLVALSNPKTIVFFTAFLPQFIDPRLPAGPQLAAMCVASVLITGASDCAWAVAAGMGRAWFIKPSPRQIARPSVGNSPHRRGFVAVAGSTNELTGPILRI